MGVGVGVGNGGRKIGVRGNILAALPKLLK